MSDLAVVFWLVIVVVLGVSFLYFIRSFTGTNEQSHHHTKDIEVKYKQLLEKNDSLQKEAERLRNTIQVQELELLRWNDEGIRGTSTNIIPPKPIESPNTFKQDDTTQLTAENTKLKQILNMVLDNDVLVNLSQGKVREEQLRAIEVEVGEWKQKMVSIVDVNTRLQQKLQEIQKCLQEKMQQLTEKEQLYNLKIEELSQLYHMARESYVKEIQSLHSQMGKI